MFITGANRKIRKKPEGTYSNIDLPSSLSFLMFKYYPTFLLCNEKANTYKFLNNEKKIWAGNSSLHIVQQLQSIFIKSQLLILYNWVIFSFLCPCLPFRKRRILDNLIVSYFYFIALLSGGKINSKRLVTWVLFMTSLLWAL